MKYSGVAYNNIMIKYFCMKKVLLHHAPVLHKRYKSKHKILFIYAVVVVFIVGNNFRDVVKMNIRVSVLPPLIII